MSSHREAPEISKDPVADSTDLYAFVSPDRPDTVTIIANYIPLQGPDGGPNFYEFGDDVLYDIHIDNNADALPEITYRFIFSTKVANPRSFLYNTGPIESLGSANWNRRQFVSIYRIEASKVETLAEGLPLPPCNVGPLSIPDYDALAKAAVYNMPGGELVFCGQRAEGFYVDLGAIFDLGNLRPFQELNIFSPFAKGAAGVNSTKAVNVHTIAIQVPKPLLTHMSVNPTNPASQSSVIGVWTSAYRQQVRFLDNGDAGQFDVGPWIQVSRLGNPLFNEVIVPMGEKDNWNAMSPNQDSAFAEYVAHPELAGLLPVLYHAPGSKQSLFPNLAALNASGKPRADLEAILLTGIPSGIVTGFQNYTGPTQADMLRLNMAVAPSKSPSNLGLIGGDAAGFPNGRRVFDDVVSIELRCVAGASYPLVDPSYTPDAAAGELTEGLTKSATDLSAMGTENYLSSFPYLGVPHSGYSTPAS
jgi:hypothetical protein